MTKLMILASIFLSSNIGIKPVEVYIGGDNIVFELNDVGITVTGGYDINYNNTKYNPIDSKDINVGDVIVGVNGEKIKGIKNIKKPLP